MLKSDATFKKLKKLKLPNGDYAVFGSGPMSAKGLKPLDGDIDLIARGNAWDRLERLGPHSRPLYGNGKRIALFNEKIEAFNTWAPGKWDIDELIDTSDIIEGVRFVKLPHVIRYKKILNRPKDFVHIGLIEDYMDMYGELN